MRQKQQWIKTVVWITVIGMVLSLFAVVFAVGFG